MSGTDEQKLVEDSSISGLVATLVPTLIIALVYIAIFLILRKSQRRWYAPRTYIGSLRPSERTPELPNGLFNWFGSFYKIPDTHALRHQSLDAYLFLRYMRIAIVITFVGCCITWPILFPVNITGGGGQQGLNKLTYSNVNVAIEGGHHRYFAHAFAAWLFYGFVIYVIFRECIFYINLRQAFLLSPLYSRRISSRTVLFTSVPEPYLNEASLRRVFGPSVRNIWITHEQKEVDKIVKERDETAFRLEKAEVKLIKLVDKERRLALKKGTAGDAEKNGQAPVGAESGSAAARWISPKKRPTHKTGALGLMGKKVDSIDHSREELQRLIPEADAAQRRYRAGEYKKVPGVFVEFRTQGEAEAAFQVLAHHNGLRMAPRHIGITPSDVIWSSLSIPWWQKVVRRYIVIAFIAVLIIFWAIPVAIVGVISNINYLMNEFTWLRWLNAIPDKIMGVITGLLPSVALAILMSLVPVIMRLCAKFSGEPSYSRVELFTQNAYFCFQVVQVWFVSTVGGAGPGLYKQIQDIAQEPGKITQVLSQALPKPGNFYNNYFLVQGLTVAAGVLSQVVGFAIFMIMYKFLSGTPRALYTKWANLSAISWGSVMPVYTMIVCIAIIYAVISPLVLAFACIAMCLFYVAWRYNILFVTDTKIDTRGLIYPRAIKQLFTGIYIAELCLLGLIGASGAPWPAIIVALLFLFTIMAHATMNMAIKPLLYNLPQSLLAEEEALLAPPGSHHNSNVPAGSPLSGGLGVAPSGTTNGSNALPTAPDATAKGDVENGAMGPGDGIIQKRGNFLTRFLMPWKYADYATMRRLVPRAEDLDLDLDNLYSDEVNGNAYCPPSTTSAPPLLWIPRDAAGVSRQEVAHTSKIIHITDEGCEINENGKLNWDREAARPPVWEEKVLY
ncbi:phosphate metabolism protein 7 [Gaeumannomyces tritici R3-111a-1]|uniref:Phosphate metabolism protein 7 n=1 Tax=Gaeumannomyces tritici (strain R3-111a-1) TaxID=644352 RepID=J3NPH4_GAET3|nr:phosphate metabolism protein 7 [Gaeumannomyces tritici R3-111a-1]EJT78079.1 phosphate metabolism protein 7 [Gaeumannomyces tritici R3-111a-1]